MQTLPETGYLRLTQIIGSKKSGEPPIIPVSRSTWWSGVKSGRYPKPSRALGERITAWHVDDIRAFIESTHIQPEADNAHTPPRGKAAKGGEI